MRSRWALAVLAVVVAVLAMAGGPIDWPTSDRYATLKGARGW